MLRNKIIKKYYLIRDKVAPQGTRRQLFLNILLESTVKTERFFKKENITTLMKFIYYFVRDRELAEKLLEKQSMAKPYRDVARSLVSGLFIMLEILQDGSLRFRR